MNISKTVLTIVSLLLLNIMCVFAQKDTLFLYTKPDCSNCQATKQAFRQIGISYFEKDLNNAANAAEMLQKLSVLGYKDRILLPVIFLNKQPYHPVFNTPKGLVTLDIETAVDSLKRYYLRGDLQLYGGVQSDSNHVGHSAPLALSDCELKTPQIYLICASYDTEQEGVEAMGKLIANGYAYAGVIVSNRKYLVYSKFFLDRNTASQYLGEARKIFSDAYLFENN